MLHVHACVLSPAPHTCFCSFVIKGWEVCARNGHIVASKLWLQQNPQSAHAVVQKSIRWPAAMFLCSLLSSDWYVVWSQNEKGGACECTALWHCYRATRPRSALFSLLKQYMEKRILVLCVHCRMVLLKDSFVFKGEKESW